MRDLIQRSDYDEALDRVGLRPCGGNMTSGPFINPATGEPCTSAAWSNGHMGLFVVDHSSPTTIRLDSTVLRDVIACGVQLNNEATEMAVGNRLFRGTGSGLNMVYLPRGERFQFSTQAAKGLKSVTIVLDLEAVLGLHHASRSDLPATLQRALRCGAPIMESLAPGLFHRVAHDVASGEGMFAAMPSLYYEGKTCELISALLGQIARRDESLNGTSPLDRQTVDGVRRAKLLIEERPDQPLEIERLAREAAMNRTKLRHAFKALYGLTLMEHRLAVLMRMADDHLSKGQLTVQEIANRAGYSNPSSFIVAYKRQFGYSPGSTRAQAVSLAGERSQKRSSVHSCETDD